MLFNSVAFLIFLPVVFVLYWFFCSKTLRTQNLLLLVASYFFYSWWSWKFLALLALSTLLDYCYGFGVASAKKNRSKLFLWLSIINNLGILAIFKYYNFFAVELQHAFSLGGVHFNPLLLNIVLPVGISFYTFHGMSYVFDIYRGLRKPVTSFVDYAVFVCFFPLLVSGPIERANHLLPQVQQKRVFDYGRALSGCRMILWGLFKKVVVADSLLGMNDFIFNNFSSLNAFVLILGAIGFSFQIYADFSGYSDIAIGTAKLFGFELLSNFKFPFFSRDIAEFWRRWHISLSSWFRDYLYIPLGGSKRGKAITIRNVFIIFLVSGLWHGASLNYVVWGAIHACGFLPLVLLNRNRANINNVVAQNRKLPTLRELLQITGTFAFVTFAFIFFRLRSVKNGLAYVKRIFADAVTNTGQFLHRPHAGETGITGLLYIIPLICMEWHFRRDERNLKIPQKYRRLLYFLTGLLVLFCFGRKTNFIYFQF